jgi:hypothetical protein
VRAALYRFGLLAASIGGAALAIVGAALLSRLMVNAGLVLAVAAAGASVVTRGAR